MRKCTRLNARLNAFMKKKKQEEKEYLLPLCLHLS